MFILLVKVKYSSTKNGISKGSLLVIVMVLVLVIVWECNILFSNSIMKHYVVLVSLVTKKSCFVLC